MQFSSPTCAFFPLQNNNSKRKMFRYLSIKPEEKVWLKLCGFEARAATDIVLNRSTKKRNKAEIIETLHSKEWSSCLPSRCKTSKIRDHGLFALHLSFCQQMFAFSRLFQSYHLNYSS